MTTAPRQEQINSAFESAIERNPTTDSCGFFAYSDASANVCGSGVGSFQWFDTRAEMLQFLRDTMAWWHPGPSSRPADEIATTVQSIFDAKDAVGINLPKLICRLNEYMRGLWQIEWVGSFAELCEGADGFPLEVRQRFMQEHKPEGSDLDSVRTVSASELDDYKEFLRDYGL